MPSKGALIGEVTAFSDMAHSLQMPKMRESLERVNRACDDSKVVHDAVRITGPFGLLADEMIDLVALHVLLVDTGSAAYVHGQPFTDLRKKAIECGRAFVNLLLSARGFLVVTQTTRYEAVARIRCCVPSFAAEHGLHPFTEQIKKEFRSVILTRAAIVSCQRWILNNCRVDSKVFRDQQNAYWLGYKTRLGPLAEMALQEQVPQMHVAWTRSGLLESAGVACTPEHVVVLNPANLSPTICGWSDLETRCRIALTPGKEVTFAMTSGDLLAICLARKADSQHTVMDEDCHEYQVWRMSATGEAELIKEATDDDEVMHAHLHGNVFVRICTVDQTRHSYTMVIKAVVCESGKPVTKTYCSESARTAPRQIAGMPNFCAKNGDFAMHYAVEETATQQMWTQRLHYYCLRQHPNTSVVWYEKSEVYKYDCVGPDRDGVLLSPTGNVLASYGRSDNQMPGLYLYEKTTNWQTDPATHERVAKPKWIMRAGAAFTNLYPNSANAVPGVYLDEHEGWTHDFFSPCGGLLVTMKAGGYSGVLVVNVRESLLNRRDHGIVRTFYGVGGNSIPARVCWNDEGMWFQTRKHRGILHLGLRSAVAQTQPPADTSKLAQQPGRTG